MTDIQLNTSENNVALDTALSEDHFDFTNQGGTGVGTVGQQTGTFTCTRTVTITKVEVVADGNYLAPFDVEVAELPMYLYYNSALHVGSTLDVEASFEPPSTGTYHAIVRVHTATGYQDISIVGTGV